MAGVARLFNGRIHDRSYADVNLYDMRYRGQVFALYFSAKYCPSCSMFTSLLAENYRELQPGKQVQVIYISSDTDEQSFHQSFQTMPWLALDYRDWQKRGDLMKMFRVDGLPKVVLLDGDTGQLISMNGTEQVYQLDYQKKYYSWASYQ